MASVLRAATSRLSSALTSAVSSAAQTTLSASTFVSQPRHCCNAARLLSTCLLNRPAVLLPSVLRSSSLNFTPATSKAPLLSLASRLSPSSVNFTPHRCYHMRLALRRRCASCFFVRRKGRLFVECKSKPRHKQMQMMSKRKIWREDYSKGNIQRAVWWKYGEEKRYYKLGDNEWARYDWLKGRMGVNV